MKVPVSYIVNRAFDFMEDKEVKTSRQILEILTANKEEVEISVALLIHMSGTVEMYKFASGLLQEFATKQEIEEFLEFHEPFMKNDCPDVLQELKIHLFIIDGLGV